MNVCIIGLGSRGQKHLRAALDTPQVTITGIYDINQDFVKTLSDRYGISGYSNLKDLLKTAKPDIAIVSVPHDCYFEIVSYLASCGVHILKEKPFALSYEEAINLQEQVERNKIQMMVACQRKFDRIYQELLSMLPSLGDIYHIEGHYLLNIKGENQGWRANKINAGGGALIDMGYHIIDLILWLFGKPDKLNIQMTGRHQNIQGCDIEDTVLLSFEYHQKKWNQNGNTIAQFTISRYNHKAIEKILVRGVNNTLLLKKNALYKINKSGERQLLISKNENDSHQILVNQLHHFCDFLKGLKPQLINDSRLHFNHMKIIQSAYSSKNKDYSWPIISEETKNAVQDQLNDSISIYNRSGIIKMFENRFAAYHNRKYALLTNSGTMAIFAAYEALALQPGDEIIVPTYTFFATATPMLYLGLVPVFCDCTQNGNIDPKQIIKKITNKTKAIMVTHMWGIPCEMDSIVKISKKYDLKLLEDCSHAHGALYKNRLVGTFGDAAMWSLQGQKIITGGEAGILLTDNHDIYVRAQLQGQYNKRCKQEVPSTHPLSKFNLTGFGLKTRVHPLAAAIANQQFSHLDDWLKIKRFYAKRIINELSSIPFLTPPTVDDNEPSWYALVFQYHSHIAPVSIAVFLTKLHNLGLTEIEQPGSTCPIHDLPIFTEPQKVFSRFYEKGFFSSQHQYPNAKQYYEQAIKLPVWCRTEDRVIVEHYITGIKHVCHEIIRESNSQRAKL